MLSQLSALEWSHPIQTYLWRLSQCAAGEYFSELLKLKLSSDECRVLLLLLFSAAFLGSLELSAPPLTILELLL